MISAIAPSDCFDCPVQELTDAIADMQRSCDITTDSHLKHLLQCRIDRYRSLYTGVYNRSATGV